MPDIISPTVNAPPRTARLVMLVVSLAVFLTALDQTVVVTTLPQIVLDLQIPIVQLDRAAWIISGYLLGYVVAMPLMGHVSDLYGRRRVLLICLCIFAFGSLFCGLAPQLGQRYDLGFLQAIGIDVSSPGLIWLVAARFIQAAGGGAIVPVAMAVAGDFYGPSPRHLALMLGLIGMVTEAGGVLGPFYGALIVQSFGWQMIFYLNLPLVALLLFFVWKLVPEGEPQHARLDLPAAVLLGASLICLSLGLSQEAAQISPATTSAATTTHIQNNPWVLALALVLFVAFILWERYVERSGRWPLIPLSLFKRAAFSATSLLSLLVGASLIIAMADIPIFIATVLGRSALDSGLALLRLTAMIPLGALLGGWLCPRISFRFTAIPGLLLAALGFWLMHLWPQNVDWNQITVSTLITGLGFGLVIAPIAATALNAAETHQEGIASAVVTVLRMIGMILGLAALTSWGLGNFRSLAASFKAPPDVKPFTLQYNALYANYLVSAAHTVYTSIFLAAGILCLLALLPAIFLGDYQRGTTFIRNKNKKTQAPNGDHSPEREATIIHEQR